MTNQLLLAQVLAAGFDWDYLWHWTHDQEFGKALVSAIAPIATAIIAALSLILSARRETKQMELSKQGMPPELTRYKAWLEVSESYKELVKFGNVDALSVASEEYREIEASRKAALERAVWERKVLSVCSDTNAQKKILNLPERFIVGEYLSLPGYFPKFQSARGVVVELILQGIFFLQLLSSVFVPVYRDVNSSYVSGSFNLLTIIKVILALFLIGLLVYIPSSLRNYVCSENLAEYSYLKVLQGYLSKKELKNLLTMVNTYGRNAGRVRVSIWDRDYSEYVCLPDYWNIKYFSLLIKSLIAASPYWVLCLFSKFIHGEWGYYGKYKPEIFGVDEKDDLKQWAI